MSIVTTLLQLYLEANTSVNALCMNSNVQLSFIWYCTKRKKKSKWMNFIVEHLKENKSIILHPV